MTYSCDTDLVLVAERVAHYSPTTMAPSSDDVYVQPWVNSQPHHAVIMTGASHQTYSHRETG